MKTLFGMLLALSLLLTACAPVGASPSPSPPIPVDTPADPEPPVVNEMVKTWYSRMFGEGHEMPEQTAALENLFPALWEAVYADYAFFNLEGGLLGQEDMCILAGLEHDGRFYSVVSILQEGIPLALVEHSDPNVSPVEIMGCVMGTAPISGGVHPNFFQAGEETVLWLLCTATRYAPELGLSGKDAVIPNDVRGVALGLSDGTTVEYPLAPPGTSLFVFPGQVVSCNFLGESGEILFPSDVMYLNP